MCFALGEKEGETDGTSMKEEKSLLGWSNKTAETRAFIALKVCSLRRGILMRKVCQFINNYAKILTRLASLCRGKYANGSIIHKQSLTT